MIPLYILAGGASSRFGSDKARAELDGVPLVMRVSDGLIGVASPATVVAATADAYADMGFRTIADVIPDQGPMGGLITALRDAEGAVFVAACDLREPRSDWAAIITATGTTAAFKTSRGWEPLFSRYELEVLVVAERLVAEGELSLQTLLDEVATAVPIPDGWPRRSSFSRPEDLLDR